VAGSQATMVIVAGTWAMMVIEAGTKSTMGILWPVLRLQWVYHGWYLGYDGYIMAGTHAMMLYMVNCWWYCLHKLSTLLVQKATKSYKGGTICTM